jgi:hypothetical protein
MQRIKIHYYNIGHPYGICTLRIRAIGSTYLIRLDFSPVGIKRITTTTTIKEPSARPIL